MPLIERQKRYTVNRLFSSQRDDYLQWFREGNTEIEPLTDCNLAPNIPYSLKKHKRWELMQELVRYMQEKPADPNNLLVAAKIDPYNSDNSTVLTVSDLGMHGKRMYQRHTNTKSVIQQQMNQVAKLHSDPSELSEKDSGGYRHPRRRRHPQHRDHHRPGDHSKSIQVDTDSANLHCDESKPKPGINAVIIEPPYMTKKRNYYFYYRRWRLPEIVKAKRQSLKTYTLEVNSRNREDWIHDPSIESGAELSDAAEGELGETQAENKLTESSGNNLFLDVKDKLITSAFVILMKSFDKDSSPPNCDDRFQCCYEDGDSVITKQSTICTPRSFAIDLTDLLVGGIRNQLAEELNADRAAEDLINYANVAYLVLREQPTDEVNTESTNLHKYSVQLQVVLTPEGQFQTTSEAQCKTKEQTDVTMSLDELIQEAVHALSRLPIQYFDWDLCLPYELYELEDPQTGRAIRSDSNDDFSHVISTDEDDTLESSFIIVEKQELEQTNGCALCASAEMDEPIQLCANNHHACSECLRWLLKEKMQSICCGLTRDEMCWECPQNQCPLPLLRLAQMQTIPLHQLVPVWKCASFLEFHRHKTTENTPDCTTYYANPMCNPGAALAIQAEKNSKSSRPSRSIDVTFHPDESSVRVFPRLYFESATGELTHSPASCETVRMFRRLYELLDDSQCMSPSARPGPGGIYPAQLPAPDAVRSDSYCNALSAAWRRNCTDKWARAEYPSSWRLSWFDELSGNEIDAQTLTKWLRTLNEIQSFVQYSFVVAHFQPDQKEYLEISNELMQKELYLGEALKLYPLQNMADDETGLPLQKSISRTLVEQMVTNAHHLNRRFFK